MDRQRVLDQAVQEFRKTHIFINMSQVCPPQSLEVAFCSGFMMGRFPEKKVKKMIKSFSKIEAKSKKKAEPKKKAKGKTSREDAIKAGKKYYCAHCRKTYATVPTEWYEDGHGGRFLTMCSCGCDIICSLVSDKSVDEQGNSSD